MKFVMMRWLVSGRAGWMRSEALRLLRPPALCETGTGRRRRSLAAAVLQHPLREILDCYTQADLY